ncbi:uncharacterized protein LOC111864276 isoform X1 [Cryptotermes secundus]|uniref:uncharacterized protein LOC111864276 isoform X1 n=1 Tax=Cryptotermes secundus TaxID=105785 RepID=UPI000CD7D5EC|nr:uncharacterized protein LOC111864276 isoform X1 [Cryptotermes secundus]
MSVSTCTPYTEKDCLAGSTVQSATANDEWLETHVAAGFKVWQIMFLCFAGLLTLAIFLCCCIRFRIPRTKQEIEADYVRKKLTKKFQKHLRVIQNSEMDDMDLKRGTVQPCSDFGSRACVISTVGQEAHILEIQDHPLDRVRAEIRSDTDSLAHSEGTLSSGCCNCPSPALPLSEPLQEPHHGRKGSLQVPKKVTTYRKICDVTTVPGVSVDDLPVQGVLGSKFSSIVETTLTKLRPKKPDV